MIEVPVDWLDSNATGIIISYPTGVEYEAQTGGYACHHMTLQGYFVPILLRDDHFGQLCRHFVGGLYGGWCSDGIKEETADFIDKLLAIYESPYAWNVKITVNRERLAECQEAWVHVIVNDKAGAIPGVLTWPNSD